MNNIHRPLALLLTFAMALTLASPVYAAEAQPVSDVSATSTEEIPLSDTSETPSPVENAAEADTSQDVSETQPDVSASEPAEEPLLDQEDLTAAVEEDTSELSYAQANDLLVSDDYLETDDFGITGEQGDSYRFTDGKPVDDSLQTLYIEEGELLGASSTAHGIDVSKWQGTITWSKTADDIDFAIIRCGFGTNKTANDDSKYLANVEGCQENNIPFGLYLYSYGESAKSEANHVLRLLEEADLAPEDLAFPIYLDMEDNCMIDKSEDTYMTNSEMLTYVTTFCDIIEDAGYDVGVYANQDWWKTYLTSSKYDQWERWLARWGAVNYDGSYNMWQYSDSGSVSGISGDVDMNYWYGDMPSLNISSVTPKVTSFYNGASGITIKWNRVTHAEGYYIYRKAGDGSYTKLATVSSPSTISYTDKTPAEGTTYSYYIQAYNSTSTSAKSAVKTILRIGSPTVTTENADAGLKTTWTKVANAEYYYLYRRTSADGDWTQLKKFTASSGTLSYVDTTAAAGKNYEYSIKVQVGEDYGGRNFSTGLILRLPTPDSTVTNGAVSSSGLKVSWNKITGAAGYRIWRRVNPSDSWTKVGQVTSGSTLSFVDTTAVDGTTYYYTVRAYSGESYSATSDFYPVKYLAAPSFSVENANNGIKISWTATKASSYRIYSRINDSWVLLDTVTGTSYVDTSVKAGSTYRYTVRPCEGDLAGCWNSSGQYMLRLATPTSSVENGAVSTSGMKVSWNKITGAAGYRIWRRVNPSDSWTKVGQVTSGSTLSFVDTTAVDGTTYYYTVRAYSGDYASATSAFYPVKYLAAPAFSVANADSGIKISWTATKASSYRIYSRINDSWVLLDTVTGTSYVDTSVKAGSTYRYTVRACEDNLAGCWNSSGKYMVRLTTPAVSVSNTSSGQKLSWKKITGAEGYYVYMRTSSTGSWQKIKTITSGSTVSYTYTSAKSGTSYYYAVRAYNGSYLSTYESTAKLVY